MKNKSLVIIISILIVIAAAYFFTRFSVLKQDKIPVKNNKAETIVDLRPALIAKLQQLIKDGSNRLYNLQVKQIDPDLLSSTLDITDVSIIPDTAVLNQL